MFFDGEGVLLTFDSFSLLSNRKSSTLSFDFLAWGTISFCLSSNKSWKSRGTFLSTRLSSPSCDFLLLNNGLSFENSWYLSLLLCFFWAKYKDYLEYLQAAIFGDILFELSLLLNIILIAFWFIWFIWLSLAPLYIKIFFLILKASLFSFSILFLEVHHRFYLFSLKTNICYFTKRFKTKSKLNLKLEDIGTNY